MQGGQSVETADLLVLARDTKKNIATKHPRLGMLSHELSKVVNYNNNVIKKYITIGHCKKSLIKEQELLFRK